jgi:Uma2 family endonuclease
VLSPSTRHIDASAKLAGYFGLDSVNHYLIIDPEKPLVIHHARGENGVFATRIARDGSLRLDPPGLELAVGDLYPATE